MPIIQIGSDDYDSDLLSNQAKCLLMELADLDSKIAVPKDESSKVKQLRKRLSKEAFEAIQTAKVI
ncbi:MAG: hypothetical protein WAO82_01360 [Limnohabitans sp.]